MHIPLSANLWYFMCQPQEFYHNRFAKEAAFKDMVRPHSEYASAVWCPFTKCSINKIEVVQMRAAGFVLNNYTYGSESQLTMKMKSDLKESSASSCVSWSRFIKWNPVWFGQDIISWNCQVILPFQQLSSCSCFFRLLQNHLNLRYIRLWNIIPENLRLTSSFPVFKSKDGPSPMI